MEGTSLFSLPEGMQVSHIQITENSIVVEIVATSPTSRCPLCSEASESIHCHYRRVLRDVPCAGRRVQLFLTVRKFSCRNPLCQRKVFAERILTFMEPWARMTIRYCQQITSIGLATCGKGGPSSPPVWACRPLARRSCAASWIFPISLLALSSTLE